MNGALNAFSVFQNRMPMTYFFFLSMQDEYISHAHIYMNKKISNTVMALAIFVRAVQEHYRSDSLFNT